MLIAAAGREETDWRRELGISEGKVVLLFAGKLEPKKRPLQLMDTIRALANPKKSRWLGARYRINSFRKLAAAHYYAMNRSRFFVPAERGCLEIATRLRENYSRAQRL
jgi:hypothetical protein